MTWTDPMGVEWEVGPGPRLTFRHDVGPDEFVAIEGDPDDRTLVMDTGNPRKAKVWCSMFLVAKVMELERELEVSDG